ncbi:hypothetical protein D3C77_668890 [compost metagenome]
MPLATEQQRRVYAIQQVLAMHRFFHIIECPAAHRLDGGRHIGMARDKNDGRIHASLEQFSLQLQATQLGHA